MFNWLAKTFASDKAVEKSLDLLGRAGDKLFYTAEEKEDNKMSMIKHKDKLLTDWIEASKGSNIARRFLAFLVAGIWAFLFLFSWLTSVVTVFYSTEKERLEMLNTINAPFLDKSTGAMMLVLGFYFAAPYMGDMVSNVLNRFGKGSNENKQK